MVNTLPLQMLPLFTEITGDGATVTVEVAVFIDKQPSELVPITV